MGRWPVVPRYVAAKDVFKLLRKAWLERIGVVPDVKVTRAANGAKIVVDAGLPSGLILAVVDSTVAIDVSKGSMTNAENAEDESWTTDISAARSKVLELVFDIAAKQPGKAIFLPKLHEFWLRQDYQGEQLGDIDCGSNPKHIIYEKERLAKNQAAFALVYDSWSITVLGSEESVLPEGTTVETFRGWQEAIFPSDSETALKKIAKAHSEPETLWL